jgi:hypothetical protein
MPLDANLVDLLKANKVPAGLFQALEAKHITSVTNLANAFDSKSEVRKYFLDGIDAFKDDPGALLGLRQAWRESESLVALLLKRKSEGLGADADLDAPLGAEAQRLAETSFFDLHRLKFHAAEMGKGGYTSRVAIPAGWLYQPTACLPRRFGGLPVAGLLACTSQGSLDDTASSMATVGSSTTMLPRRRSQNSVNHFR